jgi:hypothetical protein
VFCGALPIFQSRRLWMLVCRDLQPSLCMRARDAREETVEPRPPLATALPSLDTLSHAVQFEPEHQAQVINLLVDAARPVVQPVYPAA